MRPSSATVEAAVIGHDRPTGRPRSLDQLGDRGCLASVGMVPPFVSGAGQPTIPAACPAQGPAVLRRSPTRAACPLVSLPRRARRRPPAWPGPVDDFGPVRGRLCPAPRRDTREVPRTQRCLWRNDLMDGAGPCPGAGSWDSLLGRQAAARDRIPGTSTRMPGPMLVATVRLLKYWPLAALGRARLTASTSVARFSTSWSG